MSSTSAKRSADDGLFDPKNRKTVLGLSALPGLLAALCENAALNSNLALFMLVPQGCIPCRAAFLIPSQETKKTHTHNPTVFSCLMTYSSYPFGLVDWLCRMCTESRIEAAFSLFSWRSSEPKYGFCGRHKPIPFFPFPPHRQW